jgi:hypothetical protein
VTFLRVLVEGDSDVPAVREILRRRFGLKEDEHFVVHPHQGKGKRPARPRARPDPKRRGLLDQLPAKLRGFAKEAKNFDMGVVVLIDADDEDCRELKKYLLSLRPRPDKTLFRIAIEELESWFLADKKAVSAAFPTAKLGRLPKPPHDRVVGAWECLARVLDREPTAVTGKDKARWARSISPLLDLDDPVSPSLRNFVIGVGSLLEITEEQA